MLVSVLSILLDQTFWDKVCQQLATTGQCFSSDNPVSSTNETNQSRLQYSLIEIFFESGNKQL